MLSCGLTSRPRSVGILRRGDLTTTSETTRSRYGPVKRVPEGCINALAAVDVPAVSAITVAAVPAVADGAIDANGREYMSA